MGEAAIKKIQTIDSLMADYLFLTLLATWGTVFLSIGAFKILLSKGR